MKTLLWREFHWNRLIIVMGASILVLPYLIVLFGYGFDGDLLAYACLYSVFLSLLTIAFLGGNAFAGERADRSAQFLAYLPISRIHRLLSKLLLMAIVVAVIVIVNLSVYRISDGRLPWQINEPGDFVEFVRNVVATGVVIFGVGWLISSFQSSPTFAIGGGILTPLLTVIGLAIAVEATDNRFDFTATWYTIISVALGTLGLALGTWLFLNRVEP